MKKFLFTDGTSGVKEAETREELESFIESSTNPAQIRIWMFNSSEWINYATYRKQFAVGSLETNHNSLRANRNSVSLESNPNYTKVVTTPGVANNTVNGSSSRFNPTKNNNRWLKKFLFVATIVAGAFLVFNFTRIKWEKANPVNFEATRPDNVPKMDIDSLIEQIEFDRNDVLDKSTRNNLRLRNTWPDRIDLKLNTERETNAGLSRYFNIDVSIDNTTGLNIDAATVRLRTWNSGKLRDNDTLQFNNIRYDKLTTRRLNDSYKGDSIAVSFESIKAKSFNFCYSSTVKNNSGNYNDRWFCRGE